MMRPKTLLQQIKRRYPVAEQTIPLTASHIRMAVVDEPDQLLETLSKEDRCGTLQLPYWTYLWPSAIGLARHLEQIRGFAGQGVLELGCGFGLAGIAACQKGGVVLFTDYERDPLTFARYNAVQNGCAERAFFVQMDWNTPCLRGQFSRILASDIIYEEKNWEPILALLQTHLAPDGEAFFSEPNRANTPGFLERIGRHGFTYAKQTDDVISPDGAVSKISIYCVRWRGYRRG